MGLLRLKPIARQAAIAWFVFGFPNTTAFYFAPGGHARLLALLESQKSVFPWLKMLPNQPDFQFDPSPPADIVGDGDFSPTRTPSSPCLKSL
jgi:hypothetical protein